MAATTTPLTDSVFNTFGATIPLNDSVFDTFRARETTGATTKKSFTLKLFVKTNINKVVFAEASKDFVDFVFFILSLPVATVAKLTTGPIENIYTSFSNLDKTYLRPNYAKDALLNPVSYVNFPLLPTPKMTYGDGLYQCSNRNKLKYSLAHSYNKVVTDKRDVVPCPGCHKKMKSFVRFIKGEPDTPGFVEGNVTYMITDDLSVTPMSMTSVFSTMNKFNVSKLDELQEKKVIFGNIEALKLLKAIFQHNDVLTRVFLSHQPQALEGLAEESLAGSFERVHVRKSYPNARFDSYDDMFFFGPD